MKKLKIKVFLSAKIFCLLLRDATKHDILKKKLLILIYSLEIYVYFFFVDLII